MAVAVVVVAVAGYGSGVDVAVVAFFVSHLARRRPALQVSSLIASGR